MQAKNAQTELGLAVRKMLEGRGIASVAAAGYQVMTAVAVVAAAAAAAVLVLVVVMVMVVVLVMVVMAAEVMLIAHDGRLPASS